MRPGMFHRDGPKGMTKEELKALLPRIGDTRMETPTICDVSNRPLPQKCVVVEVHPKHLWYRVRFTISGNHECYKVPRLKWIQTGGVPW